MKRFFALLLAGIMMLSLAACGSESSSNPTTNGSGNSADAATQADSGSDAADNTGAADDESGEAPAAEATAYWPDEFLKDKIVVSASSDVGGFTVGNKRTSGQVYMCIYEKLLWVSVDGSTKLQMLKDYKQVDDLTWDFEIWDCIYDTQGNNIVADDVRFGYQLMIDSGKGAAISAINVKDDNTVDIDVTGDYTFTIHLAHAFGPGEFGGHLESPDIVSQIAYESTGDDQMVTNPIGTGPYMLKEYVNGSKIVVEANPDYWMKNVDDEEWLAENFYYLDCQNVGEIEYDVITDAATRAMALENNDVCALDKVDYADIQQYEANPSMGIKTVPTAPDTPVMFYFNCGDESPCSDVNLRKAICYALDNEAIAAGVSSPAVACHSYLPCADAPASWFDESRDYYNYDPDKAKEYLDKSNYKGETLTGICESGAMAEELMILMQSYLRNVGINMDIIAVDTTTIIDYRSSRTSEWDFISETFTGSGVLATTLRKFWSEESAATHNGKQVINILDPKLDEVYVTLRNELSDEAAEAWDAYFTDEMCYGYSVLQSTPLVACRDWVNIVFGGDKGNKLVPGGFTFND